MDSGDDRARHALSHLLLAGTSLWCVYNSGIEYGWKWVFASYGSIAMYSLVGVWRFGNPEYGDRSKKLYDITDVCVQCLAIAPIVNEYYIRYGFDPNLAIGNIILPLLPVLSFVAQDELHQQVIDFNAGCQTVALGTLAAMHENYYGLAAALNQLVNQFAFRTKEYGEVPRRVLYNTGLCFFVYFAFRTLGEAK